MLKARIAWNQLAEHGPDNTLHPGDFSNRDSRVPKEVRDEFKHFFDQFRVDQSNHIQQEKTGYWIPIEQTATKIATTLRVHANESMNGIEGPIHKSTGRIGVDSQGGQSGGSHR